MRRHEVYAKLLTAFRGLVSRSSQFAEIVMAVQVVMPDVGYFSILADYVLDFDGPEELAYVFRWMQKTRHRPGWRGERRNTKYPWCWYPSFLRYGTYNRPTEQSRNNDQPHARLDAVLYPLLQEWTTRDDTISYYTTWDSAVIDLATALHQVHLVYTGDQPQPGG